MKTLKILAILAIFVPAIAFAQTATMVAQPTDDTSSTEIDFVETGGGGTEGSSKGNVEAEFKVEEGEKGQPEHDPGVMIMEAASTDQETGIDDGEFGVTSVDDGKDTRKEPGEKAGTEDINIGVGEMKGEVGGDGEDIGAPSSGRTTYDSFFDIFVDIGGEGAQEAIDVFIKLGDIKGESSDEAMEDDEAGEVTFGDGETGARPSKPREIVVVGSKVKEVVRSSNVNVRGWDPEKKEMTISPDDINKSEDFLDFVGALTLSDENIEEVSFYFNKIEMEYDQPAKLFGFINMSMRNRNG